MSELKQYRKKPVVIEAVQFLRIGDHPAVIPTSESPTGYGIKTLEHTKIIHEVTIGDWIITGIKGEVYACKPDIFAATYEPADAPSINALSLAKDALEFYANAANFLNGKEAAAWEGAKTIGWANIGGRARAALSAINAELKE